MIPPRFQRKSANRYELPPGSRPDDAQEAAEVEERIDVREDLPEMRTEKGESSNIDSAYAGEVSRYFNERRLIADQSDAQDTELFDYDKFVVMQQQGLEKLANPATAKEMRPKDVALALGDLAGTMSGSNLEISGNRTGDPRIDRDTESAHARAKKVFMDSCEKTFPHVSADGKYLGSDIRRTVERLGLAAGAELPPDLKDADLDALVEDDPRRLAQALDTILYKTGDRLQAGSRISFDLQDRDRREEAGGHLAAGTEMFYKLQLLRDALQEKLYGRKDVRPSEARKIDSMRQAFGGADKGPAGSGGETSEPASGRPGMIERLDAALEAGEDKEAAAGTKPVEERPAVAPAGEAMRGIWKKDTALADRLGTLTDRVQNMTDLKLRTDPDVAPDFARRLSLRQIFGELLPAENKALQEAARRESERRQREAEGKKLPEPRQPVSAEKLFMDLMNSVRE